LGLFVTILKILKELYSILTLQIKSTGHLINIFKLHSKHQLEKIGTPFIANASLM